jgi:hypothetical protein
MTDQLFKPLGLRFEFRPEISDPGQEDEVSRASAYASYIVAGMKPSIAAQVVGIELPGDMEYEELDPEEPEELPETETPPEPESEPEEMPEPERMPVRFIPNLEQYRELELWQTMAFRKAKRGEPLEFEFICKVVPDNVADNIRARLTQAQNEDGIKAAFTLEGLLETETQDEPVSKALLSALGAQVEQAETKSDLTAILEDLWRGYP